MMANLVREESRSVELGLMIFVEYRNGGWEWFDVFLALIQYLLNGESKVGFLNNQYAWKLIHKVR
jgi:hypothetical protein